jgi:hypothetical protein
MRMIIIMFLRGGCSSCFFPCSTREDFLKRRVGLYSLYFTVGTLLGGIAS